MEHQTVDNLDVTVNSNLLSFGEEVSSFREISEATRRSLDQGDPDTCKQAAKDFARGHDYESATDSCWELVARLYKKASESGDLEAYFELAWLHFAGVGVQQSDTEAFKFWQCVLNSESNNEDFVCAFKTISTYMVGACHFFGVGTDLDLVTGWRLINECRSDEFSLAGMWLFDWYWGESIDAIESSSRLSKILFERVLLGSKNCKNCLLKHIEGMCYFYGFGTCKDQNKAVDIFKTLAHGGFAASQLVLGSCYFDGYVVEQSQETTVEWFKRSAEQGFALGQVVLGECYYHGYGVSQDYAMAVELYRKAADQGSAAAHNDLGNCYFDGRGVSQDYAAAVEWYRKAVDEGYSHAQYNLGYCYDYGHGVAQDYSKAMELYRMAADQGNAAALNNVGFFYDNGRGVAQDYAIALDLYRKAADQGLATAQNNVGYCYDFGHGVAQDYDRAVELYRMAADQGCAAAQTNLGNCYYYCKGPEHDYAAAVEWYRKAVDQGMASAQYYLGICYKNGCGVSQDYAKAVELLRKAADQGFTKATAALEVISRKRKFLSVGKRTPSTYMDRSAKLSASLNLDCSQSYRLLSVSTSKFLEPVREFKMVGKPKSVEEMCDLFETFQLETERKERMVVWIGDEDCFIHDHHVESPKDYLFAFRWSVMMKGGDASSEFIIGWTTLQGALSCLDYLFGLPMDSLEWSILSLPRESYKREPVLCPFPCEILEKYIQQNQNGKCRLLSIAFTPEQCRVLATCGKKTHVIFEKCTFLDGGKAFVDAYLALDNQQSGPAKVDFRGSIALDDTQLIACLPKLKELSFFYLNLSVELSRAVVSAKLDCLRLSQLQLQDDEARQILISNIREGRGLKGLSLQPQVFGSRKHFLDFCDALSCQKACQYLKTLELSNIGMGSHTQRPDRETERALLAAWRGSLGLTTFALRSSTITRGFWNSLLKEIGLQPSLRKLCFARLKILNGASPEKQTKQLSNVILANDHIVQMECCKEMFDETLWMTRVFPALRRNDLQQRLAAVEKISDRGIRKAAIAELSEEVNDRPPLLYVLLQRNLDVVIPI